MSDCKTCLDEKVLSYYGECAVCADCSDNIKIYDYIKSLKAENKKLRDALNAVISFHGFHKDIQYRDIDGKMYPLNTEQLEKILKEIGNE